MPGRLDVRPLWRGALTGLRRRRALDQEPADTAARLVLFGGSLIAGALMLFFRVTLADPGSVAGAAALLVGALLSAFGLLAVWKERLADEARGVDRVSMRALDEAVAHVLVSVIASVLATVCLAVVANIDLSMHDPSDLRLWIAAAFGAVAVAAATYVAISLLIVVNLLWDAYVDRSSRPRVRS